MTKEERDLYNRIEKRLEAIESWQDCFPIKYGEKIIRMDEKLTGGNGGGLVRLICNLESEIETKVGKKEFYWIMGTLITLGLAAFGLLVTGGL